MATTFSHHTSQVITLRDLDPNSASDRAAFRDLNVAWISKFFKVEQADLDTFDRIDEKILAPGGGIFFAEVDGAIAGVIATVPTAPGIFELAKMGVDEQYQGLGLGRRLLKHAIEQSRARGAKRIFLVSNDTLKPALHLYETLGFQHVAPESLGATPYARANVFMELPH